MKITSEPEPYIIHNYSEHTEKPIIRTHKHSGHMVDVRTEPKIKRNQPCTCGSGKKYKYCCL